MDFFELIVGMFVIYLLFTVATLKQEIKWIKETYDRNFYLTREILNSINSKIGADEKFILSESSKVSWKSFFKPHEYKCVIKQQEKGKRLMRKIFPAQFNDHDTSS